jgi:hypothetical protein
MADVNGVENGVDGIPNGTSGGPTVQRTKLGSIGPNGYPRLPPINRPQRKMEDPYANSKLMTYRLANHKQTMLMQIL